MIRRRGRPGSSAAGATGFAAAAGGADVFHPRTVRATMGAIFRIPVAHAPLLAIVQAARDAGLRLVGADAQAATSYEDFDWTQPVALLLGRDKCSCSRLKSSTR